MILLQGTDANASQCVADHLAIACDQLAEVLAFEEYGVEPDHDSIRAALTTLFKLRAEMAKSLPTW
jgi:hypothetical protein